MDRKLLVSSTGRGRKLMVGWVVAVLVAGSAAVASWPHSWPWLGALTAGAAALAVAVAALWNEARQQRAASARALRRYANASGGVSGGDLPRVAEVDLRALRVHKAVVDVQYVHRDAEEQLREYLEAGRPVLVVGSSMVGKTRMAAEVVKDLFPDRLILIPSSRNSLAAIDGADLELRTCVIWLDDLDRMIGADGTTDGALRRLADAGNAVVATMRDSQYDSFMPTDRVRPPEWDVISGFERVVLRRELSDGEDRRLTRLVEDETARERIRRVGLGEYVGAAEQITEQLRLGRSVNPVGYALVCGAADWFRTGVSRPVPADLLPQLARPHLDRGGGGALAEPDTYQSAHEWATREINPMVSLLVKDEDAYTLFDYARDQLDRAGHSIPDATWRLVVDHAPVEDLVRVGIRAAQNTDQLELSQQVWRQAAEAGVTDAMVLLGALLADRRDTDHAERWFRKAADAGNAHAMFNLGMLMLRLRRGDIGEAERWFRRAAETGHARGAVELGRLLKERGDVGQAERWYRAAADAGDAVAMSWLGLLVRQNDPGQAEEWFRKAVEAGDIDSMFALSILLRERGQLAEADQWNLKANEGLYRRGAHAGDTYAMYLLGNNLEQQGDDDQANHWCRKAADMGYPPAMVWLGLRLEQQGDTVQAEHWYQKGVDFGHDHALKLLRQLQTRLGP